MRPPLWQDRLRELRARHPALRWLERWGVSLASLASGLLALFLFRRGLEYFPWFLGYLLLLWMGGVLCLDARQALAERKPRVVRLVMDYTIQSMLHGLFLFLLPIFYASTTLASQNAPLVLLLAGAALLTTVDPWYRALFRRSRWIETALFWFGLFAALSVAFPLVRVQATWAPVLSGVLSVLALVPSVRRRLGGGWREATAITLVAALAMGLLVWSARGFIPPVPLHLARATFAQSVARLEPVQPVTAVTAAEVAAWGGLTAFTAVVAPAGLRQPIFHVWKRNGVEVARIGLSPVRGGPRAGFRTHSRKRDLGPDPAGRWEVEVITPSGQLIGRVGVTVTP